MSFTSDLIASNVLTVGKSYRVSFKYVYMVSGSLVVKLGTTVIGTVSAAGPHSYTGVANGKDLVLTGNDFEGEFFIGSVLLEEVNHLADPIILNDDTYEDKKRGMVNYTITYQKANPTNKQRG